MQNLYKNIKQHMSYLDLLVCFSIGFIFSISDYYIKYCNVEINANIIFKSILIFIISFSITFFIRKYLIFNKKEKRGKVSNCLDKIFLSKNRLIIIAAIILLFWLPTLIAFYPGSLIYDSFVQMSHFYNVMMGENINAHNPILDTFIIGFMIVPLSLLTGKWHSFIFLYVLIQAILTATSFSYTLVYANDKLKIPKNFLLICLLIYAFLPVFVTSAQIVAKDTIFSWIYVIEIVHFMEIIRSKGESINNKKSYICLIFFSLLCCLTKKVAVFVLLISFAFLLFLKILNKKKIITIIFSIIGVMFILKPIFYKSFNIIKGGNQEMFSLFFQQTACYVKEHDKDVTEDEKNAIDNLLTYDTLALRYIPQNADPVKGYSELGDKKAYLNYFITWLKQGIRHPTSYLKATGAMFSGWFSTTMYKLPYSSKKIEEDRFEPIIPSWISWRNSFSNKTYELFKNIYNFIYSIPIIGIIMSVGFYTTLIPWFCILTIIKYKKDKCLESLTVFIPLLLSFALGCLLSPLSATRGESFRYLLPVVYTEPLMILWTIYVVNSNNEKKC